jgi:TonB family protein
VPRANRYLVAGFAISAALHLVAGPFVRFDAVSEAREVPPDRVAITSIPSPSPVPTPTPAPTPKTTPQPRATTAARRPRIKIVTLRTEAANRGGPAERANAYAGGVRGGEPDAVGTEAPVTSGAAAPPVPEAATPQPTPTPLACGRPNVAAGTDQAVEPEMPPLAQQQGITGDVGVVVSLDASDRVTNVAVQSSPSALLNAAALKAARQSRFHTEVRNCRKTAADYLFVVTFSAS